MSELSYMEGVKKALEHEALAIFKYTFYMNQLKDDKSLTPAQKTHLTKVLKRLIENETEHAEAWMKILRQYNYKDTRTNLRDSINVEFQESSLYNNELLKSAHDDMQKITELMYRSTALIESSHAAELLSELGELTGETPTNLVSVKVWRCGKCGNILWYPKKSGDIPPTRDQLVEQCWVCAHDRSYAELVYILLPQAIF